MTKHHLPLGFGTMKALAPNSDSDFSKNPRAKSLLTNSRKAASRMPHHLLVFLRRGISCFEGDFVFPISPVGKVIFMDGSVGKNVILELGLHFSAKFCAFAVPFISFDHP